MAGLSSCAACLSLGSLHGKQVRWGQSGTVRVSGREPSRLAKIFFQYPAAKVPWVVIKKKKTDLQSTCTYVRSVNKIGSDSLWDKEGKQQSI
ncbi:hypothetical protein PoB_001608400 [Plakobranchus ocellatus]|uniref:Uncharacterized protein n=1 Tax=Plakobranchus ocellatus TaxID=259542 RepID=A0AAV3Z2M8_9GAST|nr:hypothetical protein PoB_001608400 [Plakobranchus ocellatus]